MAAGIHDYDHPGLNNNFHTRTAAYWGLRGKFRCLTLVVPVTTN
eukprot:gene8870-11989_t